MWNVANNSFYTQLVVRGEVVFVWVHYDPCPNFTASKSTCSIICLSSSFHPGLGLRNGWPSAELPALGSQVTWILCVLRMLAWSEDSPNQILFSHSSIEKWIQIRIGLANEHPGNKQPIGHLPRGYISHAKSSFWACDCSQSSDK